MLEANLYAILRHQLAYTGATVLRITNNHEDLRPLDRYTELVTGVSLVASFADPERDDQRPSRQELIERASRALRSCYRDHADVLDTVPDWPMLEFPDTSKPVREGQELIRARIQQFLKGLVDSGPIRQCALLLRGRLVASALPLEEIDEAQLDLLCRQLDRASQSASGTAHGELVRSDVYAHSFWYGASLIEFASDDYAVDFVRHRSKMVAKELSNLLAMLDDGPNTPVMEGSE